MAHFVKLGKGNIVEKGIVVSNDIATTEQAGVDFINNLCTKQRCIFGNKHHITTQKQVTLKRWWNTF